MTSALSVNKLGVGLGLRQEYIRHIDVLNTHADFFEIVSRRYEKGSIIITTNRAINEWDKVFIDKTLTTAVVDRLLHHCSVIEIKGESYRFKKRD